MRLAPLLLVFTICAGCAAEQPVSLPRAEVPGVPLSAEQFQEIFEDAKAIPGAQVDTSGVLVASVFIAAPPERRAMYLFTLPAHPAHPAFLLATPGDTSNESTTLTGGYAGSRTEYEQLFLQLLERLRTGERPGDDGSPDVRAVPQPPDP